MSIEQAIKTAIEGGYKGWNIRLDSDDRPHWDFNLDAVLFLDPSFWQSLGKALGWLAHTRDDGASANEPDCEYEDKNEWKPTWQYHWHRFIDHLASGGTAETFFETLT